MADKKAEKQKNKSFFAKAAAAVKGFGSRAVKFFRDTKSELKKVVWPSKKDVRNNTIVVLAVVGAMAVLLLGLDAAFGGIMRLIIGT